MKTQRLLVSVRGKIEALEAVKGGAHIVDAEYPVSALGSQYPLNIYSIRDAVPKRVKVSTNIGEKQFMWSTAAQAALGVAVAGADIIKVGLADLEYEDAKEIMNRVVRNVLFWCKRKKLIATFFADDDKRKFVDPVNEAPDISAEAKVHGTLIDTFNKDIGMGLLDYMDMTQITRFARACHKKGLEAWIAGSITDVQLPWFWKSGVDVICVRAAACEMGKGRMGEVKSKIVRKLVNTIPK